MMMGGMGTLDCIIKDKKEHNRSSCGDDLN